MEQFKVGDYVRVTETMGMDSAKGVKIGDTFVILSADPRSAYETHDFYRVQVGEDSMYVMRDDQLEKTAVQPTPDSAPLRMGRHADMIVLDEFSGMGLMARIKAKRAARNN